MKKTHYGLVIVSLILFCGLGVVRSQSVGGFSKVFPLRVNMPASGMPCAMAVISLFLQCGGGGCDIQPPNCEAGYAWNFDTCQCEPSSPIIIDISGRGFDLMNRAGGVRFDIAGDGRPVQIAWTASGADNGFLALPGVDGLVHNGKELFGNFTPQPTSDHRNGFAALAVYDLPENGGNGDGMIDSRDKIFGSLRLWIDANHDGVCQPEELHTLPPMGVNSISLSYHASMRRDQYGNLFRYRASVNPEDPGHTSSEVGRTAYDVFLTTAN